MAREKPQKILGLIGARSGSKGVPDKNIKLLGGKPLVGRIIEKARRSMHINRVVVSTDSPSYADVARANGADVPFLRPKELAEDKSPEFEYVKHALLWLQKKEGNVPVMVVRLIAAVPLPTTQNTHA